ncbi:MAG: hypothetical protein LBI84_08460, partial [Propionibacteriaceae bacterium]|nr:hypothetical protein [Propionibacteriaceae bacterium]
MSKTTAASVTGSQRVAAAERRPAASRRRVRPEDGRRHNLGLVLQNLYDSPGLSRADLSRRTGLTRVTISDLVTDLMGDG